MSTNVDPNAATNVDNVPPVDPTPQPSGRLSMSDVPQEWMPYIELARQQEKTKLYAQVTSARDEATAARSQIRALEQTIRELQEQVAELQSNAGANNTGRRSNTATEVAELQNVVMQLREELREEREQRQQQHRQAALDAYRAQRIQDYRSNGINFVESLVRGNTEQEIEASFEDAINAWDEVARQMQPASRPVPPPPAAPLSRTVRVTPVSTPPVPPVPSAGEAGVGDGNDAETLKELTSMDAIRDGSYAANREAIHRSLRKGQPR